MAEKKVRVLIVDDSALVRKILVEGLSRFPDLEIVGAAKNPYEARDILVQEKPDVVSLDVEMPRMDGLTFLKRYMAVLPTPTIMLSSLTEKGKKITLQALEAGAVEIVSKPKVGLVDNLPGMLADLREKLIRAAEVDVSKFGRKSRTRPQQEKVEISAALDETTLKVIAIGSSTGGTEALAKILPVLPATTPGLVVVQHMPAGFTASLAERLNSLSAMEISEAKDGCKLLQGKAFVAPGGEKHLEVQRSGGEYILRLKSADLVSGHRPSVDVLFHSVASQVGKNAVCFLLTGMGRDGADGLLAVRQAGGKTFAQDEQSSVVWGMPGVAWEIGAAQELAALDDIPRVIVRVLSQDNLQKSKASNSPV